jgi:hypothetical protein
MQPTSLPTYNNDPFRIMSNRPSPTDSATWFNPGTYKQGNDGNMYVISISQGGIHRWLQAHPQSIPQEIKSPRHPGFGIATNSIYGNLGFMDHKYKVGDRVKVVQHGLGVSPEDVGAEVEIIETGNYSGINENIVKFEKCFDELLTTTEASPPQLLTI